MNLSKLSPRELDFYEMVNSKDLKDLKPEELDYLESVEMRDAAEAEAPTMGDYGKATLSSIGETFAMPGRVGRAAGVGIQTGSMDKAKEAFAPDYQAPVGERAGAAGGQVAGEIAGLAAGGAFLKAPKAAGLAYSLGRSTIEGAVMGGSDAAARSGGDVIETAKGAGAGALGGVLGSAATETIGVLLRGAGGALRSGARAGVPEGALETMAAKGSSAELRAGAGTAAQLQKKAANLIKTAEKSRGKATMGVGNARKALNLPDKLETAMDDFLQQNDQTVAELSNSVASRLQSSAQMAPATKLQSLDALKNDLDKLIAYSKAGQFEGGATKAATVDTAALKKFRAQVLSEIETIPLPGVKELREAEKHYSEVADAYAVLYNNLKSPGKAQELLKQAGQGGLKETGSLYDVKKALATLEAGRSYQAGKKAAAALALREVPSGVTAGALEAAAGPSGRLAGYKLGQGLVKTGEVVSKQPARIVGSSVARRSLAEVLAEKRRNSSGPQK
ncbi:MAG: hypothetical protein IPL32_19410 [Chloracidobacterium sp.]|nr:hypothetical protein [Chloracidobacterium sp.]